MGKVAQAKRDELGDKYIGRHGTKIRKPARNKKARVERLDDKKSSKK